VLGPDGPRVIDFGIARALEAVRLTRTGAAVGTPGFMVPEQLLDLPVTPMIDVFALGSLAAYAVLGRPPFGYGPDAAVSYRVLHEAPDLNGCSPRLRALIEPCLAKQPASRPQLSQILRFCLGGTDLAAGSAPAQELYRPAGMVADSQATPPLPTMTARVAPQFPPTGRHGRPVRPRRAIKGIRLIYLGGLLAVGVVVVAAINILPAISATGHQKGALGGKTVAPTGPCSPKINAVGTFEATATQTVKITGSCFGVGNVASERDTAYFRISDQTAGWNACWNGDPNGGDYLTCDILSWTNQEITFTGFAGGYGQDGSVSDGDHIEIQVWDPQSGKGPATYKVVAVSAQ
jgi:protein kinase-like protein